MPLAASTPSATVSGVQLAVQVVKGDLGLARELVVDVEFVELSRHASGLGPPSAGSCPESVASLVSSLDLPASLR